MYAESDSRIPCIAPATGAMLDLIYYNLVGASDYLSLEVFPFYFADDRSMVISTRADNPLIKTINNRSEIIYDGLLELQPLTRGKIFTLKHKSVRLRTISDLFWEYFFREGCGDTLIDTDTGLSVDWETFFPDSWLNFFSLGLYDAYRYSTDTKSVKLSKIIR